MPWGVAAAAGVSILGGIIGQNSASNNMNNVESVGDPIQSSQAGLGSTLVNALQSPSTAANANVLNGTGQQLANLIANPGSATQTAQYQAQLQQGLAATNSTLSAQGLNGSGAQSVALNNYASSSAQNQYNTQLTQLSGLYGQSQSASSNYLNQLLSATTAGTGSTADALAGILGNNNSNGSASTAGITSGIGSLLGLATNSLSSGSLGSNSSTDAALSTSGDLGLSQMLGY